MNLDDANFIKSVDQSDLLAELEQLPEKFALAWTYGKSQPLPFDTAEAVEHLLIVGVGEAAIIADLLAQFWQAHCRIPIQTIQHYSFPTWANEQSLVLFLDSGDNSDELWAIYEQAKAQNTRIIGIMPEGALAKALEHDGQAIRLMADKVRLAAGELLGAALALGTQAAWYEATNAEINQVVNLLKDTRKSYGIDAPIVQNAAKRYAGQLVERLPFIIASGIFEAVGHYWKMQLNRYAKSIVIFEALPEMQQHAILGVEFPQAISSKFIALAISSARYEHPANRIRLDLTSELFMMAGIVVDRFEPRGESPLAQVMCAMQFGDYLSYYTAIAYQTNPSEMMVLDEIKLVLAERKS